MLTETIISARGESYGVITPTGVNLRTFVSEDCGAASLSTGIATFVPRSYLPYHLHAFSEAITVLEGAARILIEGRTYILSERDCIHVPAATAHQVENADKLGRMVALWAFASAKPTRTQVEKCFLLEYRGYGNPKEGDPESIIRFDQCPVYELSENAAFLDLFAKRFGAQGICGGYGRFSPGASLPCHIHDFDESITIVKGSALCLVQGRSYELSGYDTAFIRKGVPHRFMNRTDAEMAMLWVYAGDEPDRQLVDTRFCSGKLEWKGIEQSKAQSL
jgi:quercetin dioxygenase-like cupin family protein